MKTSKIAILAALGVLAFSTQASADCPGGNTYSGSFSPNTNGNSGFGPNFTINSGVPASAFDSGPKTDSDCFTAGAISIGEGSAVSGVLVTDPNNPNNGAYLPPVTAVYGQNSSAIGHGAFVGRVETYIDDKGTANTADDTEETRLVPVNNGTALGAGAVVEHDNSTAVGSNAKSTDTNQVTLGTKDETIRAEGITSQKSKDRQIGPREVVTSDSGGRLATDGGEIFTRLDGHDTAINAHSALLSEHSATLANHGARLDSVEKGLAIATAMPDTWLSDKQSFAIAAGVGGFGDEIALGFAAIGRIDDTWSVNAGFGGDTEFKEFGWKAGVRAGW